MINQYIPGYQPPTSPNPNPIEDIIRNPNQSNPKNLEPTNPIWNKFWNSVPKNDSIGKDNSKEIYGVFEYCFRITIITKLESNGDTYSITKNSSKPNEFNKRATLE